MNCRKCGKEIIPLCDCRLLDDLADAQFQLAAYRAAWGEGYALTRHCVQGCVWWSELDDIARRHGIEP